MMNILVYWKHTMCSCKQLIKSYQFDKNTLMMSFTSLNMYRVHLIQSWEQFTSTSDINKLIGPNCAFRTTALLYIEKIIEFDVSDNLWYTVPTHSKLAQKQLRTKLSKNETYSIRWVYLVLLILYRLHGMLFSTCVHLKYHGYPKTLRCIPSRQRFASLCMLVTWYFISPHAVCIYSVDFTILQ